MLEAALAAHHAQLLGAGLAVSQNPGHTARAAAQTGGQDAGRGGKSRKKRLGGEPFVLWDFEAEYTRALDQWVVGSACELGAQVARLAAGEEWRPASSSQRVAVSVVELQRLLQVRMGWRGWWWWW